MIYSMTGFGKAEYQNDEINIRVEIKALNYKNFNLNIKFHKLPIDKENELHKLFLNRLIRGKITSSIQWELKNIDNNYNIKEKAFADYYYQLKKIAKNLRYKPKNLFQIIINLPNIWETKEIELNKYWNTFITVINNAIDELIEFRKQEGQATEIDIKQKINKIQNLLQKIDNFESQRNEYFRKKLYEALNNNDIEIDKNIFEQQLIFYLDKYDINEEKKRLKNHINYFLQTIDNQYIDKGKKLTFITQEIGREINTLGNKSFYFEIQKIVVEMKDNLEKIKEQLANIL